MIDKKEGSCVPLKSDKQPLPDLTEETAAILAQSQQLLELTYCQVQAEIRASFARLSETLRSRERQLLRQLDVLQSQQVSLLQSHQTIPNGHCPDLPRPVAQVRADLRQEQSVSNSLQAFGKVDVEGGNLVAIDPYSVPYRVEEYQEANEDHVCLYKPLSNESTPQQVIRFSLLPRLGLISQTEMEPEIEIKPDTPTSAATPDRTSQCGPDSPQVQQWLQQILAETETEPLVAELEKKFSSMGQVD